MMLAKINKYYKIDVTRWKARSDAARAGNIYRV